MSEREGFGDGEDSPPDEFAHLFRPDDPAPDLNSDPVPDHSPPVSDLDAWEPLVAIPTAGVQDPPLPPTAAAAEVAESEIDGASEVKPPAPAAVISDPKEGRLFRSRGAPESPETVTAVGSMQARRLRTLARSDEPDEPAQPAAAAPQPVFDDVEPALAAPLPVAASGEPAPALQVMSHPPAAPQRGTPRRADRENDRDRRSTSSSGTLTGLGVYAVTIGVTVILAFGETLFFGGQPGIITGIGLLAVSIFAAFTVRTRDAINAIFAPPIAFFVATITAGQLGLTVNSTSSRLVEVFFLLGGNWVWIVGSTVSALVIVALRRRLS